MIVTIVYKGGTVEEFDKVDNIELNFAKNVARFTSSDNRGNQITNEMEINEMNELTWFHSKNEANTDPQHKNVGPVPS